MLLRKNGADGGGRTHTASRPLDFESSASANSATSAQFPNCASTLPEIPCVSNVVGLWVQNTDRISTLALQPSHWIPDCRYARAWNCLCVTDDYGFTSGSCF